jgi:hypothetical protein
MILRCTGKLLSLLGTRPSGLVESVPNDEDWYANLLWLERRKCLLMVHGGTLFPVFATDIRKAEVAPIGAAVVALVEHELIEEDLPTNTFGELDPGSVLIAKTASRVVLGYMNEIARFCEYAIFQDGGLERCDVGSLNRALRRELHLSRNPPGYFVPIDVVRAGQSVVPAPTPRPRLTVVQ